MKDEKKKGFLVRSVKKGKGWVSIGAGTPYEIQVYFNGVNKHCQGDSEGLIAFLSVGEKAKDVVINHHYE